MSTALRHDWTRDELRALLCDLGTSAKIRIAGYGTTQDFVPAPPIDTRGVTLVQLGGMAQVQVDELLHGEDMCHASLREAGAVLESKLAQRRDGGDRRQGRRVDVHLQQRQ